MIVELTNSFVVDLPIEEAWQLLTDAERVVPCLPGAALVSAHGDDFDATVKIKVGPITANYSGSGTWVERDDKTRRAVLRASGKDVGGQGGAAATVTMILSEQGEGTTAEVLTDLALSGRVAQFGRGVVADVSSKMLSQFVLNLKQEISPKAHTPRVHPINQPDHLEAFDAGRAIGPVMKRYGVPIAGAALSLVVAALILQTVRGRRGEVSTRRASTAHESAPIIIQLIFGSAEDTLTRLLPTIAAPIEQLR